MKIYGGDAPTADRVRRGITGSLRLVVLIVAMLVCDATSSFACPGNRPWPRAIDDPKLKPDHIPMQARISSPVLWPGTMCNTLNVFGLTTKMQQVATPCAGPDAGMCR